MHCVLCAKYLRCVSTSACASASIIINIPGLGPAVDADAGKRAAIRVAYAASQPTNQPVCPQQHRQRGAIGDTPASHDTSPEASCPNESRPPHAQITQDAQRNIVGKTNRQMNRQKAEEWNHRRTDAKLKKTKMKPKQIEVRI